MSTKYPRNSLCPCGSGKKYKHCCIDKGFEWTINDNGDIGKLTPASPGLVDVFDKQAKKFKEKFGREPGPDDKIFFDAPTTEADLEEQKEQIIEIMKEAGMPPQFIYAFQKTGRMVSEENKNLLTDIELKEWNDAVKEYRQVN